jgi:uncharacterized membrane-anchored protein
VWLLMATADITVRIDFDPAQLREQIAKAIEAHVDPEWPNDEISTSYKHAANIARGIEE